MEQKWNKTSPARTARISLNLRIPGHADHRSGIMSIKIPQPCRSGFRDDVDHDSGLMPIRNRSAPEC